MKFQKKVNLKEVHAFKKRKRNQERKKKIKEKDKRKRKLGKTHGRKNTKENRRKTVGKKLHGPAMCKLAKLLAKFPITNA